MKTNTNGLINLTRPENIFPVICVLNPHTQAFVKVINHNTAPNYKIMVCQFVAKFIIRYFIPYIFEHEDLPSG